MALSTYNRSRKLDPQPDPEPQAKPETPAKPERPLYLRGRVKGADLRNAINKVRAGK